MGIIDADAHVIEIDQTWEYMDPSERHYKPGTAYQTLESGEVMKYWVIDGRAIRTAWPGGGPRGEFGVFIGNVALPTDSKFMLDVQARIAHMDELGTDLQVLFPSMWDRTHHQQPRRRGRHLPKLQPLDGRHLRRGQGTLPLGRCDSRTGHGRGGKPAPVR